MDGGGGENCFHRHERKRSTCRGPLTIKYNFSAHQGGDIFRHSQSNEIRRRFELVVSNRDLFRLNQNKPVQKEIYSSFIIILYYI